MNKLFKKLSCIVLTLAVVVSCLPNVVFAQAGEKSNEKRHSKQVIGYVTQWDAWKGASAGLPAAGALNQLNLDYSKYTMLNFSFFGVAYDGSLHSGDGRNKQIYSPGVIQQPNELLFKDIYSSWDYYLLFGELDLVQYINEDVAKRAKAQGFDVKLDSNTWSHPGWGLYNQPLPMPLKKENGLPGLFELTKQNGVKLNASIGGWSMCKHFPEMAADPAKRARFVKDCVRLINMGFDGIDLDWEYPGPFEGMNFTGTKADYDNYITLVREIRQAIGPDKLITSCFSANTNRLQNFNWGEISKYVDYFNFMTYDMNGGWSDKAGHNSPLHYYKDAEIDIFNWDHLYNFISKQNIDLNRVTFGVPFYGRGVVTDGPAALNAKTVKRNVTIQPDGPISTSADYTNWPLDVYDGTPTHFFIKQKVLSPNSGWKLHWDDEAKVPYATKDNFFLSYDDERSIEYKAKFINEKKLGGVIVWNVYQDLEFGGSVTGTKLKKWSDVKSPLVSKINEVFANGSVPDEKVSAPVFTPAAGTYENPQNVTISCATDGATIRYTTDGSDPTVNSTVYKAPIKVDKTTTIKAKAFKASMEPSATVSATYQIKGETPIDTVSTPVFDPAGGTYENALKVTIGCSTEGATIRYTTDGTEPTENSAVYENSIIVEKTTTIKAKAFKSGMNDSATASATYVIDNGGKPPVETVSTPIFDPAGGKYDKAQKVTISCATDGATIRYTTDGSEPNENSDVYTNAINVAKTTTLKAKAFKSGMNDSLTASATYTISTSGGIDKGTPHGPPVSPFLEHNNWDGRASYEIKFNIWWGNNATSYKLYENGVIIDEGPLEANSPNGQSKTFPIKNKANGTYSYKIELANSFGKTMSNEISLRVTQGSTTPIETVATPVFNPEGGTFKTPQKVTISCATDGATIRYTTDGSEPTEDSKLYSGAIDVAKTTTIKAKAFKSGMKDSATATATFVIDEGGVNPPVDTVATPVFNPAAGTYKTAQKVTISCATAGATIRYTTDGSEPNENSKLYSGAIDVAKTTTLKAKAFKSGMKDSATATAAYVIDGGNQGREWRPYTPYKQGDIVSYKGQNYKCRQPHTSLPGWEPPNVPALWELYSGSVTPIETVSTPAFNPASGTYKTAQKVTISCGTTGATIRYTTDGSEPTENSSVYSGAINVVKTTTIKAKAFKSDMNDSATATASYVIDDGGVTPPIQTVANPVFNPAAGKYTTAQNVTISCATSGATIRYTTDGSEPTATSALYSGAIAVASSKTLKAKAFKSGMNDSATVTASYVIDTAPTTDLKAHVLTGYWHNFDNDSKCLKISDVPASYDIIAVSFADSTTTPGKISFTLDSTLSRKLGGYTKQEFIMDIAEAKVRGQKVILSVGGEKGSIRVDSAQAATNFANSAYELMVEYGFQGVDIDLENGVNSTYMASALRQLSAKYGKDLIITMAPQTIDMQNVNAEYFKLALSIKDILTIVNMQYYNSGSMLGYDGKVYSQGNVDFLTALATIQLEGGLRPDQVGLGLPAAPKGGGGYVNPTVVNQALNCLAKGEKAGSFVPPNKYPTLRGAMTWSINWDATNNYNFANTVRPTLDSLGSTTPPIQTVASPTFSKAGGRYETAQNITISCETSGATIRYTTDGSEPNANSTIYNGSINVSKTTTLKAKAFKTGMKDSATAFAVYTIGGTAPVKDKKVVGYYPSWEPEKLDRIQYDVLTHINYAFAIPTSDAGILPLDNPETVKEIIKQAHNNGVKVSIAIGGWSYKETPLEPTFVAATNTDAKIQKLTAEIMKVVNEYGFDGVDMDWEHPRNDNNSKFQYEKLMLSLRKELNKQNKLLTAAVLSGVNADGLVLWDAAGHTDTALSTVDWVNVMAYDGGDAERHSSFNFAVNSVNYWVKNRKMDKEKVVLGVPFYGRPSWATYDEILEANPDAYKTDTSMIRGMLAHYNGVPTIERKTKWAKENCGGVMMWEISQDTIIKEKSLLSAIGRAIL